MTLAIDPGIAADVGWQLSFAAVLGILLLASAAAGADRRSASGGDRWRRALAEGVAVTVAATLATAPLIAFHFETVSTTTLVANVLALPAVAPAMWLGMCGAGLAQLPGLPLEPLNGLDALLLAYVAQVAAWCAAPELGRASGASRRPRAGRGLSRPRARAPGLLALAPAGDCALGRRRAAPAGCRCRWPGSAAADAGRGGCGSRCSTSARATRSCCSRPARPAVLVDGGPPGDGLARKLEDAGVERLGAAIVTHDQSDHAGGIEELLGSLPVERLLFARVGRGLIARAAAAGADAAADRARAASCASGRCASRSCGRRRSCSGRRRRGQDPNRLALVIEARWRDFTHAADRRRRGRGGADRPRPGRRAQGRPPRQRRCRPRRAARSDPAAAGGDLGRRGQPLRAPDRGHAGDPPAAPRCRLSAPTRTATIVIDVGPHSMTLDG